MLSKTLFVLLTTTSVFSDLAVSQKCTKQSCQIADASGSTGRAIDGQIIPTLKDVTDDGRRCIEQSYLKLNLPVPPNYTPITEIPPGYTGRKDWWLTRKLQRAMEKEFSYKQARELDAGNSAEFVAESEELEKRQLPVGGPASTCAPKTLVWARGTLEPPLDGNVGLLMGPYIKAGLAQRQPGQWQTVGIDYIADFAGDYCIGLPGGIACVDQLTQLAKRCPQTKFIVGGYSQGAMVSHNCVAFVDDSVRARVAGMVLVGDPFNGAPIRKYPSSNVLTFCDPTDGVCGGSLDIGLGHLSYNADNSVERAINWILTKV